MRRCWQRGLRRLPWRGLAVLALALAASVGLTACAAGQGLDPFAGCAARALYASCLERVVPPPAGGARDLR